MTTIEALAARAKSSSVSSSLMNVYTSRDTVSLGKLYRIGYIRYAIGKENTDLQYRKNYILRTFKLNGRAIKLSCLGALDNFYKKLFVTF